MGIAAFLVWKKGLDRKDVKNRSWHIPRPADLEYPLVDYLFRSAQPGGALVEIVFLWLAILATIVAFYKISKPAAWLFDSVHRLGQLCAYLNYAIWALN